MASHRITNQVGKIAVKMARLTVAGIRASSKPGRYSDGGTLYLMVAKGGSKSKVQRINIDGRRHDIGLGGFPLISLSVARERAMSNRLAVANGRKCINRLSGAVAAYLEIIVNG